MTTGKSGLVFNSFYIKGENSQGIEGVMKRAWEFPVAFPSFELEDTEKNK